MSVSDAERRGDFSRRKFLERLGLATAVGGGIEGGLGLPAICWADEGDSGPVDCGPPPPTTRGKMPTRWTRKPPQTGSLAPR